MAKELKDAFIEQYEWIRDCCKEMEEKPSIYTSEDKIGLPYAKQLFEAVMADVVSDNRTKGGGR